MLFGNYINHTLNFHAVMPTEKYPLNNFKDDFCPQLVDQIFHGLKGKIKNRNNILLLVNLINREDEEALKEEKLIYGGILKQRSLIEGEHLIKSLDSDWEFLAEKEIPIKETVTGGKLFKRLRDGEAGLKDLKTGTLETYFRLDQDNGPQFKNAFQKAEYPILQCHFNLEQDLYLSLPLILFGKLNGIVHIIFEKALEEQVDRKEHFAGLIMMFLKIYEKLYLSYGVRSNLKNTEEVLQEEFAYISSPEFQERQDTNKFFKEMNLLDYYKNHKEYLRFF